MKSSIYSFIACLLLVFVFIQCNSSPTQQNITQVVGQQWRDSITIDMFSARVSYLQRDTTETVTLTAKGQALLKPVNLIFDTLRYVYAPAKYQPSKFECWEYNSYAYYSNTDSTLVNTDTNTVLIVRNKSDNSFLFFLEYASLPYPTIQQLNIFYMIGNGFRYQVVPYGGEFKIYYE